VQPAFVFEVVGSVFVLAHTKDPPSEGEWSAFMTAMKARMADAEHIRTLVFTDGGGPNAARRDDINQELRGRKVRTAVHSNAAIVRFMVSSLALFNPSIRSFEPKDVEAGLAHVDLSRDRKLVRDAALRLQGRIGAGRCSARRR